jgi:hypothetical protein
MKKIVALIMIVSFLSANATAAFAEQRVNERGRVSGRVENRNSERRPVMIIAEPMIIFIAIFLTPCYHYTIN